MTGIILMVLGSVLLISGVFVYSLSARDKKQITTVPEPASLVTMERKPNPPFIVVKNTSAVSQEKKEYIVEKNSNLPGSKTRLKNYVSPEKKGYEFEKYVIQKFNRKLFKVKEWAGDKYVKGIYAETTTNPDMLFEFTMNDKTRCFAVECKWRNRADRDGIQFSTDAQLERYRKYEREKNTTVFIVLGIAGKPSSPEHLYIIPLMNINTTFLRMDEIKQYEKNVEKTFLYDHEADILR